jgi:hypothetical protein
VTTTTVVVVTSLLLSPLPTAGIDDNDAQSPPGAGHLAWVIRTCAVAVTHLSFPPTTTSTCDVGDDVASLSSHNHPTTMATS